METPCTAQLAIGEQHDLEPETVLVFCVLPEGHADLHKSTWIRLEDPDNHVLHSGPYRWGDVVHASN